MDKTSKNHNVRATGRSDLSGCLAYAWYLQKPNSEVKKLGKTSKKLAASTQW
jgi:hypothetical protein